MPEKPEVKISEEEAQLYDRQIRLWGLDAQKRLRSSRVLIAGMSGLGCEVAKNLVLAGIKSLKMMDQQILSAADGTVNFLAPRDKIGTNRAEACLERVQALNPMVDISADTSNIAEKDKDFFVDFDIVLVTGQPKEIVLKLNNSCRSHGGAVKFFSGDVHGFFGYSFMDLVDHEFAVEVTVQKTAGVDVEVEVETLDDDTQEPAAKKAKVEKSEEGEDEKVSEEPSTKMEKQSMKFVSLEESLKVNWGSDAYKKRIRRMDPAFFLLHVLYEFQSREGRSPKCGETKESDLKLLQSLRSSVEEKFSLPENKIPEEILPMLFSELSPVAAIVGGVLGQEIIKVISNQDAPHNNFFLYNPLESCGVVETIGY